MNWKMLLAILLDQRGEVGDLTPQPEPQPEPPNNEPQPGDNNTPPPGDNEPQPEPQPADEPMVPRKALEDERRKRQEAAEQLAYYRGVVEGGAKPNEQPPQGPQIPMEPQLEQFDDFQQYEKARERYLIDVAKHELSQEFQQKVEQTNRQRTEQEVQQTFMVKMEAAAEHDPEILNFVQNYHIPGPYHIPVSDPMAQAIKESDCPAQIIRYLAGNKQEAAKMARLSPLAAAKEIGKLEAKILNTPPPPKPKQVSAAPEPITTVDTSGNTSDARLEDLPMEEFVRRRNAEQYQRHR